MTLKPMGRLALAILIFAAPALAQRTVVTGTVKDVNGVAYAGGTLVATLSLPVGGSGATLNGVQIGGATQRVTLDGTGSFLMQLPDNAIVIPGGTQWTFNVNISPGAPPPLGTGPQNCSATLTITGASQSVSSSLSACPALGVTPSVTTAFGSIFAADPAYGLKNNTVLIADVTTTSGSGVVTCPNLECKFLTTATVGMSAWVTNGPNSSLTTVVALTTIQSIASDNSMTLVLTANANLSGTAFLVYGSNDRAALNAANAAAQASGKCLYLPAGNMQTDQGPFVDSRAAGAARGIYPQCIVGTPNTQIIIRPDYDFTTCAGGNNSGHGCFIADLNGPAAQQMPNVNIYTDITFNGTGQTLAGSHNNTFIEWHRATARFINLWGIGATTSVGVQMTGPNEVFALLVSNVSGTAECNAIGIGGNQTNTLDQSYCTVGPQGLVLGNSAVLYSHKSFFGPNTSHAIITGTNSTLNEDGDIVEPECNFGVQIAGKHNFSKSMLFQSAGTPLLYIGAGATTTLEMATISNTAGSGVAVTGLNTTGILNVQGGPASGNSIAAGTICPTATCSAIATPSETQTGTCAANAATVTFLQTYRFAPLVMVSVTTSGSTGGQATATSTTTGTIHCNGATDAFVATVIPNPI